MTKKGNVMTKKKLKAVGIVYAINWSTDIFKSSVVCEYYELNNGKYIYAKHANAKLWEKENKKIEDYFVAKPVDAYSTYEEADESIRYSLMIRVGKLKDALIAVNSQLKKYVKYRRKS